MIERQRRKAEEAAWVGLDDIADKVVGQPGHLGSIRSEALRAGIVDAERRRLDAGLIHVGELGVDVHVLRTNAPMPLSGDRVVGVVFLVGARDGVARHHEVEDRRRIHVTLHVDPKRLPVVMIGRRRRPTSGGGRAGRR